MRTLSRICAMRWWRHDPGLPFLQRASVTALAALLLWGALLTGPHALATQPDPMHRFGPYFLGHETEPAMEYGGRVMTSLHTAASDLGAALSRRFPYIAPAYEVPLALVFSTLQHEIHGHGARAREYNLKPSYGFGLDFSAYTTIDRDPRTLAELSALAAGGTEANAIMAQRILLDFCRPRSIPASAAALLLPARLDLSVYIAATSRPRADEDGRNENAASFTEEYEQGNDIAIYLATRQATRRDGDPSAVWRRDYAVDFDDPLLRKSSRQTRDVALWNALDPMLWATMFFYVRDHAIRGARTLPAPALPLGDGYGIAIGTRGSIEPQSVSRFLDVYFLTPSAVFGLYGRDLVSTTETTHGYGARIHRLALGSRVEASLSGAAWEYPQAPEKLYDGTGWNVNAEIEIGLTSSMGLALKAGVKNAGYYPGVPTAAGLYGGGGVTAVF